MKYQGNVAEVKAIQKSIQQTKLSYTDKKTGWEGEAGIEPSTLYTIRLVLQDISDPHLNGWLFYISFNYRIRDDYGEVWIKDADLGRLFKVFPQALPLFGKLLPIILPEKEARLTQEKYRIGQQLRNEA
jgi:hypothetical protein